MTPRVTHSHQHFSTVCFFLIHRCFWTVFERMAWVNIWTISLFSALNNSITNNICENLLSWKRNLKTEWKEFKKKVFKIFFVTSYLKVNRKQWIQAGQYKKVLISFWLSFHKVNSSHLHIDLRADFQSHLLTGEWEMWRQWYIWQQWRRLLLHANGPMTLKFQ